ncbi:uncharacterized protein LOC133337104 [Musca vetustissima]|uniref:uncharacterized protein LOC133337104 n=1 Tax=Musca vetustissima TaxID=27455 RepID=UPI002AB7D83D|nr:uncharacterized protein LOC133337104 [Musca vetustissima]
MRTFLVLCFIAAVTAQYQYGVNFGGGNSEDLGFSKQQQVLPLQEEYSKSFYSFSAPEHEFEDPNAAEKIASALKKNLRVVFIKGPENKGLENAVLQLAKTAAEDRTAIYVLNKQSDIGSLVNQLQELKSTTDNRPEVHFVKYRTQADAENAQRTIQSQYDSLPGTSIDNAPRSASVLNFASKSAFTGNEADLVPPTSAPAPASVPPSRSYIPPRSAYIPPSKRV